MVGSFGNCLYLLCVCIVVIMNYYNIMSRDVHITVFVIICNYIYVYISCCGGYLYQFKFISTTYIVNGLQASRNMRT